MKISFSSFSLPTSGAVGILAGDGGKLSADAEAVDKAVGGAVSNAIKVAGFKGEREKTLDVIAPAGSKIERIIVVGAGKADELDEVRAEYAGGCLAGAAQSAGLSSLAVCASVPGKSKLEPADLAARVASGMRLRVYRFDKYKSKKPSNGKHLTSAKVLCEGAAAARKSYGEMDAIAAGRC